MKRTLLTLVLMAVGFTTAFAYDAAIGGVYYDLFKKAKTATVVGAPSSSTTISLPETITYDGVEYTITGIDDNAFYQNTKLKVISVSNTVTSIGDWVFWGCTALTSISLGNSLKSIGKGVFGLCSSLKTVTIPNSVTDFDYGVFFKCTSLTSVTLSDSISSIGWETFDQCSKLKSVDIPNSVTEIAKEAFYECTSLESVTLPNALKTIESSAFYGCSSLTTADIPNSVTNIGTKAFFNCSSLKSVNIPNSLTEIASQAFKNCDGLTTVVIPNSVLNIGAEAFCSCDNLTSVTIGNSVLSIDEYAFSGCENIEDVYCYPEEVPTMGNYVFSGDQVEYSTLHVPDESVESYKEATQWKDFGTIIGLSEEPEPEKTPCATPVITFANGKITATSETEGSTCHLSCSATFPTSGTDSITLTDITLTVSAYATAEGYTQSETATKTINLTSGEVGDVNNDGVVDIADINAVLSIMFAQE